MSRIVVMGLGRFGGGAAAARWYAERGHDVLVTDTAPEEKLRDSIAAVEPLGVRFRLGGHDPEDFERCDLVVVNPAVPFDHPLVALAPRYVTEIGLTLQHLRGPVVAVTGTNGKSTTASLIAAMLDASGVPVVLGGNIGRSLLNDAPDLDPVTVAVLELSSFQLHWLEHREFAPVAAVVTNVTGDHFDRHPDFEHYVAAKRRLAEFVPEDGVLILPEGDPVCAAFAACTQGAVEWFGARDAVEELRLMGKHNQSNAAAARKAALAAGATEEGCRRGAASFRPLPHRLEDLGERAGVLRINDAVSTTPVATAAAVDAFARPVILLTGGRDKGLDLGPLLEAAGRARAVVAYGESGTTLGRSLPEAHLRRGLDDAVRCALDLARPGDVVLLSPGFASYDEFPGFDARGARFRELVDDPV